MRNVEVVLISYRPIGCLTTRLQEIKLLLVGAFCIQASIKLKGSYIHRRIGASLFLKYVFEQITISIPSIYF